MSARPAPAPPCTPNLMQEREIDRLERDPNGMIAREAYGLERDRARWLVKAYLRTRLAKVQQFAGARGGEGDMGEAVGQGGAEGPTCLEAHAGEGGAGAAETGIPLSPCPAHAPQPTCWRSSRSRRACRRRSSSLRTATLPRSAACCTTPSSRACPPTTAAWCAACAFSGGGGQGLGGGAGWPAQRLAQESGPRWTIPPFNRLVTPTRRRRSSALAPTPPAR